MDGFEPQMTDPAREAAELLTALQGGNRNLPGDQFLASHFGVDPWSQGFFRIIATIMDSLADLRTIVSTLGLDHDYRTEAVGHIIQVEQAFSSSALHNLWSTVGGNQISPANVQPIKVLSGLVRQQITYRKLSDEEVADLINMLSELLIWLEAHQIGDQDFIRQALIDGVSQLRFRLTKFKWLGWGYTLESLREVIAAYMMLERQQLDPQTRPDAAVLLTRVGTSIKAVYEKMKRVKDAIEMTDWLLAAYGASTLTHQAAPIIKGLLPGNAS